jgi:competence protein ComEA
MENSWEAYFIFSEKERRGIIVLGVVFTLSILFSIIAPHKNATSEKIANTETPTLHLFKFNPNTIDSIDAIALGIPVKQVHTLLNYRNKGGRFFKKEDILKLYGLDPFIANRLIPFIELTSYDKSQQWGRDANRHQLYDRKYIYGGKNDVFAKFKNDNQSDWSNMKKGDADWVIDINEADAKEWMDKTNLPINIVHQILNYKNYLGGFTNPKQLKKVYGLTDSLFQNVHAHLVVQKNFLPLRNSSHMNFLQWKSLGIFEDQQIFEILKLRKLQGGRLSWRDLVILLDLPEKQALWLKSQIIISD